MNDDATSITVDDWIIVICAKRAPERSLRLVHRSIVYLPLKRQIEQIFVSAINYSFKERRDTVDSGQRQTTYRFGDGHIGGRRLIIGHSYSAVLCEYTLEKETKRKNSFFLLPFFSS